MKNLINQKINRLTVLNLLGKRGKFTYALCLCECGKEKEIMLNNIISEKTKSCGCLQKERTSMASKGRTYTLEQRKKMSIAHRGKMPSNLQQLLSLSRGRKHSQETKEKMSKSRIGKKFTAQHIEKLKLSHTFERRAKAAEIRKGVKSHLWKGGITNENELARKNFLYKKWREEVFKRDDYTCTFCKIKGGFLHADHIKPFALYSDLRFDVNNGRTLCIECHKKTDTYGGKIIKYAMV